ncbi:MAG: hypothetical protein CMO01_10540 [Thalassobius sp.]|nr:hypothetical protein [Thalassovita sp.]|tara:strand:+ start:132 stop:326 length:195 start_codon:yes stop_codon:yes gene_type:complete
MQFLEISIQFLDIFILYLIGHSPAILLLIIGFALKKSKPKAAKVLFIIAGIYFVIGAGVCGSFF